MTGEGGVGIKFRFGNGRREAGLVGVMVRYDDEKMNERWREKKEGEDEEKEGRRRK